MPRVSAELHERYVRRPRQAGLFPRAVFAAARSANPTGRDHEKRDGIIRQIGAAASAQGAIFKVDQAAIAKAVGCSVRHVHRVLAELERAGYLTRIESVHGRGGGVILRVDYLRLARLVKPDTSPPIPPITNKTCLKGAPERGVRTASRAGIEIPRQTGPPTAADLLAYETRIRAAEAEPGNGDAVKRGCIGFARLFCWALGLNKAGSQLFAAAIAEMLWSLPTKRRAFDQTVGLLKALRRLSADERARLVAPGSLIRPGGRDHRLDGRLPRWLLKNAA